MTGFDFGDLSKWGLGGDPALREALTAEIDLVDLSEIANRTGVKSDTVNKWRFRGLFPEPDIRPATGPLWYWATVQEWAIKTGRLK